MSERTAAPTVAASIGRRAGAYALDIASAYLLVVVIGGTAGAVVLASTGSDAKALAGAVLVVWVIVLLVWIAWLVIYSAMQGGRGSIGQRATGVLIRDAATGAPIGFWRALLRNVVWGLAASIVVGYFSALFDSSGRRQGWHDLASRSVVVVRHPALVAAPASPPAPAPASPSAPASPTAPVTVPAPFGAPAGRQTSPPPVRTIEPTAASSSGLISQVPGSVTLAAPPRPPAAPAAAAAPTGGAVPTAPAAAPLPATVDDDHPASDLDEPDLDELDQTRAAASLPSSRIPDPAAIVVLTWDNGTRMAVYGRTLYGRNPETEPGAARVAVRDETLSLSKTHFELGGDAAGPWIIDRHSTNGSVLVRNGSPQRLIAGVQTTLRGGDRLEFGDRSVEVSTS